MAQRRGTARRQGAARRRDAAQRQAPTPRAVGRVAGRARTGPVVGRVRPIGLARTEVARIDPPPPPVFADLRGIRRRRLRRWSIVVVSLLVLALLAFWLSQLSGDQPLGRIGGGDTQISGIGGNTPLGPLGSSTQISRIGGNTPFSPPGGDTQISGIGGSPSPGLSPGWRLR